MKCEVDNCVKFHHLSLHMVTKDVSVTTIRENGTNSPDYVLLPIMKVTPDSKRCRHLSCLWVSAADYI